MSSPSVRTTIRKELLSFQSIFSVLILAVVYIYLSVFLLNYRLVLYTLTTGGPIGIKVTLLSSLFEGIWTSLSPLDFILVVLTAILVGYNVLLLGKTIYFLKHQRKIKFSIGGATLIALVTTGCASCGLSILSILGLSTSLYFLPFRGLELHIGAIALLLFSLGYMVKQIHNAKYCGIPKK